MRHGRYHLLEEEAVAPPRSGHCLPVVVHSHHPILEAGMAYISQPSSWSSLPEEPAAARVQYKEAYLVS